MPNISAVAEFSSKLPQTPCATEKAVSMRYHPASGQAMPFQAYRSPARNGPRAITMMASIQPAMTAPLMPLAKRM